MVVLLVLSVLVGMLLAASTGIAGASVVTMGLLSMPTMLKRQYNPALSSGDICASWTLGQIIPPSIALILLGDQLSTEYQNARLAMGNFSPDLVPVSGLFAGTLILVGLYLGHLIGMARRVPCSWSCGSCSSWVSYSTLSRSPWRWCQ